MAIRTHYDNLQVSRNASDAVIRAAYKSLMQRYHPDKNPDSRQEAERITRIINEAFEVLSNPALRSQHDDWIAAAESSGEPSVRRTPEEVRARPAGKQTKDPDFSGAQIDKSKFVRYLLLYMALITVVVGFLKSMGF
jgi:curved DNA-binding protein CbpA